MKSIKDTMQGEPDWYRYLLDDCNVIYQQRIKESRQSMVMAYHELGERLRKDEDKMPITKLVQRVAVDIKMSERSVWNAVRIYTTWPDPKDMPDGDNVSVKKLIKRLEKPEGKEDEDCTHEMGVRIIRICKGCGKEIK